MSDYPSLVKSWQFNVNQQLVATGNQAADARNLMWALVASLLGYVVPSGATTTALTGTVTTTFGSTSVTFSSSQTIAAGTGLIFSNQPGVTYYLASSVSGFAGVLAYAYYGTGGAGQTTSAYNTVWAVPWTVVSSSNNSTSGAANNWVPIQLSGTVTTNAGSTSITFSGSQTLPAGAALIFSNQPGVIYYLSAAVSSASGTLTSAYLGTGGSGQTTVAMGLTWATGAANHSWIALKQTGISSNFQILISLNSASNYQASVWISPSVGFTGGSTTVDPTATDSTEILTVSNWGVINGTSTQYKLHTLQTTDGACTRLLICNYSSASAGGACTTYISFEVPQNPVTGWTNPSTSMWISNGGTSTNANVLTNANLYSNFNTYSRASANFTMEWTGEANNGTLLCAAYSSPNDLNGEWIMQPIGLFSATVGSKGRHGSLFDIWWGAGGSSTFVGLYNGIPYNAAATAGFAQFGAIILPWNGSVPQMA